VPKQVDTVDVRRLAASGAQLVEVLPEGAYEREHLPGAVNVPFTSLDAGSVAGLDPAAPTVVYCYDHECDLSARAAHRFEALGFTDVYDYVASKAAWMACGLPIEGTLRPERRAGAAARPAVRCALDATVGDVADTLRASEQRVVVTTDDGVVLGVVRGTAAGLDPSTPIAAVLDGAPPSVRPSVTTEELAESMDRDHRTFVLVTTPDGVLIGVIEREQLLGRA
jgi:rhodanese-related sulfurtransferase